MHQKREEVEMRPRQIAAALLACMALGALAANAAQAGQWTIGTENQTTAGTKLTGPEAVTCKRHGTTELAFTSTLLGLPLKLTASGVDCVNATIETTKEGLEHGSGSFKLTGVSMIEPDKKCSVSNVGGEAGQLTTALLTSESSASGTKYFTDSPSGIITFEFKGVECSLTGASATIKGSCNGALVHTNAAGTGFEPDKAGTLTRVRTISAGASCALTLGTKPVLITGAGDSELSGANAAKPWGAD